MLVYDEEVPRHSWRIAIVKGVLPRDSKTKGLIASITNSNAILKRPVNKLFPIEYQYHNTAKQMRQGNKS